MNWYRALAAALTLGMSTPAFAEPKDASFTSYQKSAQLGYTDNDCSYFFTDSTPADNMPERLDIRSKSGLEVVAEGSAVDLATDVGYVKVRDAHVARHVTAFKQLVSGKIRAELTIFSGLKPENGLLNIPGFEKYTVDGEHDYVAVGLVTSGGLKYLAIEEDGVTNRFKVFSRDAVLLDIDQPQDATKDAITNLVAQLK